MAENKKSFNLRRYYNDLSKLFQGGPTVRHRVANKVAAPGDVGIPIGTARAFLRHVNNSYASAIASYGQYNRLARYSDYNEMEAMAEIGSGLDIYADEACAENENGEVIKIDSPNMQIKEALKTLFYDVLNIEFNAFNWIRNLCKYGDQFFLLDHHPDYGVLQLLPMPVNEVEREEGYDPSNPLKYRYRWVTQGNRVLEPWQVIHFRLMANDNFLPYGSAVLEPARRVWRQLILMEDAVMVYRIVRSPERRVFYIGVGNVAPGDIPAFMEKAKTQLKRNQIVDTETGRVDLRYNALSTDEDYFIPVRGEGDGTRIETLPGGQFTGDIEDLQYIQNKLFAALKIPKSYLGYEQDISGKATLSQEDVRFAHTIKRVQKVFIAELNKIAVIHLFSMGFSKENLVNFEITMANPSTISELQKLELWRTKFEVASVAQEGMFDRNFIYKKIWMLNDEDIEQIEEGKRKDRMFDLEIESMQAPAGAIPEGGATPPMPGVEGGDTSAGENAPPEGGEPAPVPPEAGLPPPPGEEGSAPAPVVAAFRRSGRILDHKDPNAQVAAPRELMMVDTEKDVDDVKPPDLLKYAFGIKKTSMDPKRSSSEITRTVRAPFGEEMDPEEKVFEKNVKQIQKLARELENVDVLMSARRKKTKKLLL
jgi:hypothetical protein